MRHRRQTALGIDIGEHRVSLALVEQSEQGFRTIAAAGSDLPADTSAQRGPALGKALSALRAELGRGARRHGIQTAVAVSPGSLVMQLLDPPAFLPTNVGEFVQSELQQYVALSGKPLLSDFCGVGAARRRRLLAVAADTNEIQETVEACNVAGLMVDRVEPSILAYARALLEPQGAARYNETILALLDAHRLTVGLFRRTMLDFIRMRDQPADTGTPERLGAWLSEELQAVVRYLDMETSGAQDDRRVCVVVHDNACTARELSPWLAGAVPAGSLSVVDAWEPSACGPATSMVAAGAALACLHTSGDDPRVNLVPQTVGEARSSSRHLLLTANVAALLLLAAFAAAQLLARTTGTMSQRLEQTRLAGEVYTAPALMAEEKFLDQGIAHLRERLEPLRRVTDARSRVDWPRVLNAVRQATPAEACLTHLQCGDARTLSLKGLASSADARRFVRNLDAQEPFESVCLTSIQRQANHDKRLEYQIDCLLKAHGGNGS